ncbi:MAG TPA: DUF2087 domain-containing protein [Mycobacteriales bacterium]|nr:DUF2087 domain-containing protein [Mycobacteriales bacterium]
MPDEPATTPASLVGLLAEDDRLRVVAALALGARKPGEVLVATGLTSRELAVALGRLVAGGLVATVDGELELRAELFTRAARAAVPEEPVEDHGMADPRAAAVLRTFVRAGQVPRLPTSAAKRRVVLEHIVTVFEPGVHYAEREVNAMLRAWHDDHATLRRYLVDEGLLARERGEYWRVGGWVDTTAAAEDVPTAARREQRLAAYALVEDGDAVLLCRLRSRVHNGRWTLPGGGVDFGERPADAVVREVYEETGLTVRVTGLLDVDSELMRFERDGEPVDSHPVRVLYRVEVTGGTLGVVEVGGSTEAVRWWPRGELAVDHVTPYAWSVVCRGTLA